MRICFHRAVRAEGCQRLKNETEAQENIARAKNMYPTALAPTLWVFIGLLGYLMAIRLVVKYQARPIMKRLRVTPFSAAVGIILLVALLKMGTDWDKIETFKRNGVITQADVTGKFTELSLSRFGGTRYKVVYEYADASGDRHTSEDDVPHGIWGSLSVGGKVEVKYSSDDPSDSAVNTWARYYESIHVCIALSLLSSAALWWATKKPQQHRPRKSTLTSQP